MDELQFWKQKVIQFFHDPPGKPFTFYPGTGGHQAIAKVLFAQFTGGPLTGYNRRPDWAAAGADRPILVAPRGVEPVQLRWPTHPLITHPLCPAIFDARPVGIEKLSATAEREQVLEDQEAAVDSIRDPLSDWQSASDLHRDFTRLWRRFRDELIASSGLPGGQLLWEEMPADTRTPDHSIWDHLRVTTGLAFLPSGEKRAREATDPQAPWLLRFTLHPVQRFIQEARTSRDLWTGSFLLADLTWHAMKPIVDRYGHDSILYPDLRGNPLVDFYLDDSALPERAKGMPTFASMLPATFTAVVPYGASDGFLRPIAELASQCDAHLQARWRALEQLVWQWLMREAGPMDPDGIEHMREIWNRQHCQVISGTWTAVAWLPMGRLKTAASLRGRALPAQQPEFRADHDPKDLKTIEERKERLAPWVSTDTWNHYEHAREVYARTRLDYHQLERGFDYALTHHQLATRHALRKAQSPSAPPASAEPGEKCTCCGRRQALTPEAPRSIFDDRKTAMKFWKQRALDPDETGSERLCAVCGMKRFLVEAGLDGNTLVGINPVWAGRDTPLSEVLDRDRNKVRVPFPSTATVAAQRFIEQIATRPELEPALRAVVEAHRALGLPATSFPRALARLDATAAKPGLSPTASRFLELEAEEVLFPDAILGQQQGAKVKAEKGDTADRAKWREKETGYQNLASAVAKLRKEAAKLRKEAAKQGKEEMDPPNTRIAVLAMDGDQIGRLLLGERELIKASWRDVIHPDIVDRIDGKGKPHAHLIDSGWPALLDARRLTGPSLHAWISRALAGFSNILVPWVVEREFSGRLIYSGGDELLCLVPGDEALDLAARLQQLFSAPWVIDTQPETRPWDWRRRDGAWDYDQTDARRRFATPVFDPRNPVRLPIGDTRSLHPHVAQGKNGEAIFPETPVRGRVIPMLGSGRSLSAGIALAHYKSPLGRLIARARTVLKEDAKGRAERAAVGISHASRGGEKVRFAIGWNDNDGTALAHPALTATIAGFQAGRLSGRLPYKLRELSIQADTLRREVADPEKRTDWLRNLFNSALGDGAAKERNAPADAAYRVWKQGLDLCVDDPTQAVAGLLLCRALAGREEEAE